MGDEYIGQTKIDRTVQGDELELLFGVEDLITVERKLTRRDVDKKLLGDKRHLRYGYAIELKNLLPAEATIVLKDHFPLSRHEQIKVKLEEIRPQPTEQTQLNLVEWQLKVASGTEVAVEYEYSVVHPRSLKVAGLLD